MAMIMITVVVAVKGKRKQQLICHDRIIYNMQNS